jgi:hypothetical protein
LEGGKTIGLCAKVRGRSDGGPARVQVAVKEAAAMSTPTNNERVVQKGRGSYWLPGGAKRRYRLRAFQSSNHRPS